MNTILKTSLTIIGGYILYNVGRMRAIVDMSFEKPDDSFEIHFKTATEAYRFMAELSDAFEKYHWIDKVDLKEILGEESKFTDMRHGWTSMDGFKVHPDGRVFVPASKPLN